jgi:hypothetical protein
MFDLQGKFSFGIDLDDPWHYAGLKEPRSTIIPHLLSISLPEGRIVGLAEEGTIRAHGESEPSTAAQRATLALKDDLADLGVDFVRCWFPWAFFEPVVAPEAELDSLLETSYQAWPMDSFVSTLTEGGIGIIPVVACGYQRMLPGGLDVDRTPDLYLRRASIHARLLVRRYKSKIKFWQIENEPNWWREHEAGGWRRGASWLESDGFALDLLKTLNNAVHEEDSNAQTMINLEGDEGVGSVGPFSPYCDFFGLDFYPNYRASSPVNVTPLAKASDVAQTTGKPAIIAETGYPSGPGLLGYGQEKQREYVKGASELASSLKGVKAIGIWRYKDGPWKSFPDQENNFGLIDSKGRRKLAWGGLAETIQAFR